MKGNESAAVSPHFDVMYEDDETLVVNKSAPLLTHPVAGRTHEPTLLHGVRALLCFEQACGARISLINRLDRETSGLVLIAKTPQAARELGCAMMQRRIRKAYLAITCGAPLWESACCAEPIVQMLRTAPTQVRIRQACHTSGKDCCTHLRTLLRLPDHDSLPECALIACRPITGRMHQLRVHLAHLGYPLLGDKIYGGDETRYLRFIEQGWTKELASELIIERHALHASELSFPSHGHTIHVSCEMPSDMAALLPRVPHEFYKQLT